MSFSTCRGCTVIDVQYKDTTRSQVSGPNDIVVVIVLRVACRPVPILALHAQFLAVGTFLHTKLLQNAVLLFAPSLESGPSASFALVGGLDWWFGGFGGGSPFALKNKRFKSKSKPPIQSTDQGLTDCARRGPTLNNQSTTSHAA